tara:strand:+ start:2586 stop:3275 length:690 start_codon:yes stop_codon:yes gene_type:complete
MSSDLKVTNIKHESSSSNNLVLASDGSATATLSSTSVVPASIGGSMHLISKATASNSGSIQFTGINSLTQYRNLVFYVNNLTPATNSDIIIMRVATSGTSYDSADYSYRGLGTRSYYNGSSNNGNFGNYNTRTALIRVNGVGNQAIDGDLNGADGGFSAQIVFYNAPHDAEYHGITYTAVHGASDGYIIVTNGAGQYVENSLPITAIQFVFNGGNISSGSIAMYGIKDA